MRLTYCSILLPIVTVVAAQSTTSSGAYLNTTAQATQTITSAAQIVASATIVNEGTTTITVRAGEVVTGCLLPGNCITEPITGATEVPFPTSYRCDGSYTFIPDHATITVESDVTTTVDILLAVDTASVTSHTSVLTDGLTQITIGPSESHTTVTLTGPTALIRDTFNVIAGFACPILPLTTVTIGSLLEPSEKTHTASATPEPTHTSVFVPEPVEPDYSTVQTTPPSTSVAIPAQPVSDGDKTESPTPDTPANSGPTKVVSNPPSTPEPVADTPPNQGDDSGSDGDEGDSSPEEPSNPSTGGDDSTSPSDNDSTAPSDNDATSPSGDDSPASSGNDSAGSSDNGSSSPSDSDSSSPSSEGSPAANNEPPLQIQPLSSSLVLVGSQTASLDGNVVLVSSTPIATIPAAPIVPLPSVTVDGKPKVLIPLTSSAVRIGSQTGTLSGNVVVLSSTPIATLPTDVASALAALPADVTPADTDAPIATLAVSGVTAPIVAVDDSTLLVGTQTASRSGSVLYVSTTPVATLGSSALSSLSSAASAASASDLGDAIWEGLNRYGSTGASASATVAATGGDAKETGATVENGETDDGDDADVATGEAGRVSAARSWATMGMSLLGGWCLWVMV